MKIFSRLLLELPDDAGDHGVKPGAFMVFRYTLLRWLPILVLAISGGILLISGAAWFYPGSEPGNRSEGWWYASHSLGLSWTLASLAAILLVLYTLGTAGHNRITRHKFNAELARLQRHNQQLEGASDISGIVNWELDLAANTLTFDDRSYRFLGTSAVAQGGYQLPLEVGIEKFIHPGDRRRVRRGVDTLRQAVAGATLYSLRFRLVNADGATRQVCVRVNAGGNNQGGAGQVLCAAQDISATDNVKSALQNARDKLEDELLRRTVELTAKEQRCRELFEHNPMPMWEYDTRTGCFTDVNATATKLYGYTYSEFVGMRIGELFAFAGQALAAIHSKGQNQGCGIEDNVRLLRRDGSTAMVILHSNDLPGLNSSTRMLMAHDIDEQVRAESELQRQQELTRNLLENLAEGVVACDEKGGLVLFNKVAREWHGMNPELIPPEEWANHYDLFDADGVTPLAEDRIPLMRAFQGEHVRSVEMSIVRKGYPPRFVLASGESLYDAAGNKLGAVVAMHDVTAQHHAKREFERFTDDLRAANAAVEHERASLALRVEERTAELTSINRELARAMELAEAGSQAKSAFLAVMSHEIRTPMNGILGMIDVLSQAPLEEDQASTLGTIRDSSLLLLKIIDDVLDFSKIEAGHMELERAATILPDLLEGVCDALALTARDKGVTLNLFIDPTLPTQIWSDPTRLRQVLYNLIGNAVKFSGGCGHRPGRVEVCVERHANNRDFLAFSVRDNGVGISPKALPGLFNSFSQAEISTTRRFGGSGLGLAICKRLVELMGGKIMVQSTPEIGSDFTMVVPMQPVSEQSQVPGPDLRQLDCILVGVDKFHNRTLVTYLTHAGAAVHQVPNIAAIADCNGIKMSVPTVVIHYPEADQGAPAVHSGALPGHQYLPLEEMAQLNSGQVTGLPEVRNLLLKRGARQHARVESPDKVVYEDYFVRRQEWLHAVAVAAGRSSPLRERQAREEVPKVQPAAMSVAQARQNEMLILVAEDDAINQKVVLRQLSLLGYAAEVASNGVEALELWQSGQYGLLLTDLHMPEMDGYELASRIRQQEHEQGSKHLPILMLSANALRGEAARARARGVDVYLTKPLQLNELREVLEQWLPNNQGRGSLPVSNIAVARQDLQCVLDLEALTGIFGDDEQGKRKLLADFLGSSKLLVGEMEAAMQSRKYSHLSGLAHRLKASARAIGALPLGDACGELENVGRAEDFRAISECMRAFNDQFTQVEAAITRQAEGMVNA